MTTIVGPALATLGHDLHWHGRIALRALHDEAFLLHFLRALLAQEESDIGAGLGEARAPISADRTGAEDEGLHFLMLRSATQSASHVARSSVW